MLAALLWSPTPECLYREVGGAKQLCSEFRFQIPVAIGSKGQAGFISWDAAGRITVAVGYVWDGASGPTVDTVDTVCASLGHDVLYQMMRLGFLAALIFKPVADRWLYERLLHDGMIQYRAFAWYKAVQVFGGPGVRPGSEPEIKRAPLPYPAAPVRQFSPIPGYYLPALYP